MASWQKTLVVSLFLFLSLVCSDGCNQKPTIFNFGDGNSDTGGFSLLMGVEYGYPDGRSYFHEDTGRRCDGRLILDFLCQNLSRSFLTPYMEPTNYFRMGANFAMSGSRAFQNDSNNPFSLDVQVHQFSYLFNRSTELSAEGDGNFLGAEDFANALYTFDIGQVDLIEEFNASNYNIEKVLQFIPPAISRIKNAMQLIHNLGGGKNFWVHNIGPLGCLPEQLGKRNSNPFELDEYGCLAFMNEAAIKFNSELDILCQQLRLELSHSTIVYVDVYSIKYDLVANSASYGFERPLMACCGYGGPPYNFDWHISCRDAGHNICGDEKPLYISWDGTQYTEAANSIVAAQILSTTYSSPPLDLHFFCA